MNGFLKVNSIQMIYQTPGQETMAVKDVSFCVEKGEFISIVGPSGCGKSTILSCMAGLREQQAGEIMLEGKSIAESREKIGYMLQSDNLMPWRSVWRNVLLGLEIKKQTDEDSVEYVKTLLKRYDLWQFRDAFPAQLSGGMRQRAALIRTLALKPQVLLLDEAFSALDYQTRVKVSCDVFEILRRENKTIVMVTHDIPEAVSMSDRVVILSQRPAVVQKIVDINLGNRNDNPIKRRTHPGFQQCFNSIWRELVSDEKSSFSS